MSDTTLHLGIDAGELSLKVVLYDAEEKAVVKMASLDVPVSPLNDISTLETTIQNWLNETDIHDLASVSLTVSAFRAIVEQIFVPPEVPDLDEYLKWFLSTRINDNVSHYLLDYQKVQGSKELGWTILFMALRSELVYVVRKGFKNKKLIPQLMNIDVLALLNLVELGYEDSNSKRCIVKADVSGVSVVWLSKDNLILYRGISTLDLVGKNQTEAYQLLSKNIAACIQNVSKEFNIKTEAIELCGDIATDSLFFETLQMTLPGNPVQLLNALPKIKLNVDEAEASYLPLCAGALGVALQAAEGV